MEKEKSLYLGDSKEKICEATKVEEARKNLSQVSLKKLRKLLDSKQKDIYLKAMKQELCKKSDDILSKENISLVRKIMSLGCTAFLGEFIEDKNNCFLRIIEACLNIGDIKIDELVVKAVLRSFNNKLIKKLSGISEEAGFPEKDTKFTSAVKNMLNRSLNSESKYLSVVAIILNPHYQSFFSKLVVEDGQFCDVIARFLSKSKESITVNCNKKLSKHVRAWYDSKEQPQIKSPLSQEEKIIEIKKKLESITSKQLKEAIEGKEKHIYLMAINEVLNETELSNQNTEIPTEESVSLVKKILTTEYSNLISKLAYAEQGKEGQESEDKSAEKIININHETRSRFLQIIKYALNDEIDKLREFKNNPEKQKHFEVFKTWNNNESEFMTEKILCSRYRIFIRRLAEENDSLFLKAIEMHLVNNNEDMFEKVLGSRCSFLIRTLSGINKYGKLVNEKCILFEKLKERLIYQQKDEKQYKATVRILFVSRCCDLIDILRTMDSRFNADAINIIKSCKYYSEKYGIEAQDSEKRQLSVQPVQANQQIDHKQQTCHDEQTYSDYNCYDHYYYDQYRFSQIQSRLDQYEYQVDHDQTISNYNTNDEFNVLVLPPDKYCESKEEELQNLFLAEEEFNDLRKREMGEYDNNTPSAKRNF